MSDSGNQLRERERMLGRQAGDRLIEWVWELHRESAMTGGEVPGDPLRIVRSARDHLSSYLEEAGPGRSPSDA